MKKLSKIVLSLVACATLANAGSFYDTKAQFEPKKDRSEFDKVEMSFNTNLTFNFQGLSETNQKLQNGLSLPTADLDINAKLMKGFNVKLETMLSSHNHHDTYVKGGYASIDSLDFVAPGFLAGFMDQATIKVGVNEINFGDDQYRRSDNADVFKNVFVSNMAVQSYLQAGFVEVLYRLPSLNSFIVAGITNGQVNPDDTKDNGSGSDAYSLYTKLGFDKQINDNLRIRLTESIFYVDGTLKSQLYGGDKAGGVATNTSGGNYGTRWTNPLEDYDKLTVSKTNLFIKAGKTEIFALYEFAKGEGFTSHANTVTRNTATGAEGVFIGDIELKHYAIDLTQRFGKNDKYYVAGRYENAKTKMANDSVDDKLTQIQVAAGMYFSNTAMAKIEYFKQNRDNFGIGAGADTKIEGFMISTALSF